MNRWTQEDLDAATEAFFAYRKSGGDWRDHPTHAVWAALEAVRARELAAASTTVTPEETRLFVFMMGPEWDRVPYVQVQYALETFLVQRHGRREPSIWERAAVWFARFLPRGWAG